MNFSTNWKLAANSLCASSIYIIRTYKTGKAFKISWENRQKSTHRPFSNLKWMAFCFNERWKSFCFSWTWQWKEWKRSFVASLCFEEREWMQKLWHMCNQNVPFTQANQHIRLSLTATIEEEAFSMLIEPKCSPFEVGKWTMRWFLTIFSRYFECFSSFEVYSYVYWWQT